MHRRDSSSLDFPLELHCRSCDASQPMVFGDLSARIPALGIRLQCGQCDHIALLLDGQGRTLCPRCEESMRPEAEVAARGAYAWISCPECRHTLVTLYGLSLEVCAQLGVFPSPRER